MAWKKELDVALEAAREAGRILLHHYEHGTEAWEKAEDNPLTLADLESDRAIAERISAAFPDDGMLSEETVSAPDRPGKRRVWIIDPMDGTKEFTRKIPEFCVSIALVEDGVPVVAVILNPPAGITVWASQGNGTFRDGERVHVSQVPALAESVMIASRTEISRKKFEGIESWFHELRPVGSIAWKLACVASGDGDLNVSLAPKNEWDVCAGDLLVREAGGRYVDFAGETRRYNQENPLIESFMLAGPAALVEEFCTRYGEREGESGA